ncbi:FadR/GntR family transcriptional regulator [Bradyrhizobium prioriisuperbiae]|uniref:FadR/GntR family transcriptional regulator n=1 Tax=Bradyrhizobium prioriisuperbiae TaxID=2854389 RepID=UPI0028E6D603|nr:FCD domain-containing protein [Bradyrhizobium prioritasuperba]
MVLNLLSRYIEAGAGTQLPPERQLAAEFGVSRNEIRKALARLEADGQLTREVGRGTFVRAPLAEQVSELDTLQRSTSPREAMEARLLIEPELASLAAINASYKQIETMQALATQMRHAKTWEAYEQYDGRLHCLIAEAAGNKLLAAVHGIVNDVRRAVVWKWLDTRPSGPPPDYSSFDEHDAIIGAIEKRDRAGAMDAMRRHLRTTSDKLIGSPG